MHPHHQTTIDRALASGIKITDDHVKASSTLQAVALDYVQTYKGFNSFVQDIAVKLAENGTLSAPQMRGALNVMVAEARPLPVSTLPDVPMTRKHKLSTAELSKGSLIDGGSGDPRQLTKRQLKVQQRKQLIKNQQDATDGYRHSDDRKARWAKAQADIDELFPE